MVGQCRAETREDQPARHKDLLLERYRHHVPNSATNSLSYNGLDTRVGKVDSAGTATYKRDGAGVTAPVLSNGSAAHPPGLSQRISSTSTFFHGGIKNTDTQTNSSKSITATRVYDAFGNVASSTGSWSSPFGYAGSFGYQEDGDSGLKLLGHRYYDSSTGRFLSRDPAMAGRNWYVYCDNNPVHCCDPHGLYEIRLGWHQVLDNAQHSFVIVTDNNPSSKTFGVSWAFSAGPERHGIESLTNPGKVKSRSGLYRGGHYDSPTSHDNSSWPIAGNNKPVAPLLHQIEIALEAWKDAKWDYSLTGGTNSNSFAHMILDIIATASDDSNLLTNADKVRADLHNRKRYVFPGWEFWRSN